MRVKMVVEIPRGSHYKYEVDKVSGKLKLDRVLNQTVPEYYGFSPGTLFDDGDPIDLFLLNSYQEIPPLTEVEVEIHSIIRCSDNGVSDDKLIAFLPGEYIQYPEIRINQIKRYLNTYKEGFYITGEGSKEEAEEAYRASVEAQEQLLEMGVVFTDKV